MASTALKSCDRCLDPVPIHEYTRLACAHLFHAKCAADFLYNCMPCIICVLITGIDATPGAVLANVHVTQNSGRPPVSASTKTTSSSSSGIDGIAVVASSLRALLQKDPRNLATIAEKMPDLCAMDLVRDGIDCEFLLAKGIILPEVCDALKNNPMVHSDLVALGFNSVYMMPPFVTMDLLRNKLRVDCHTLTTILPDLHFIHLEQLKVTLHDLIAMRFTMRALVEIGLTIANAHTVFDTLDSMLDLGLTPDLANDPRFNIPHAITGRWPLDYQNMVGWCRKYNVRFVPLQTKSTTTTTAPTNDSHLYPNNLPRQQSRPDYLPPAYQGRVGLPTRDGTASGAPPPSGRYNQNTVPYMISSAHRR